MGQRRQECGWVYEWKSRAGQAAVQNDTRDELSRTERATDAFGELVNHERIITRK